MFYEDAHFNEIIELIKDIRYNNEITYMEKRMITTLAPSGINCELCYTYQKKNCYGCRGLTTTMKNHCSDCDILKCDKKEKYCYVAMNIPAKD